MVRNILYKETITESLHSELESNILSVLAYFDLFHYPLRIGEIEQLLPKAAAASDLHHCLGLLLNKKLLFRLGDYYSLENNYLLAVRRTEGNRKAEQHLLKAVRIGRFLQRFPFVKAVGISGSLSKNYADEKSDFDFFIITAANRLWIARTCMHIFKKAAILLGKQRYYCMNYYVDEQDLLLPDQNIFTAIELKTLLPVAGERVMTRFFEVNDWTRNFLPGFPHRRQEFADKNSFPLKRLLEWIFQKKLGERLDNWLFRVTTSRWKRKEEKGRKNDRGEVMLLLTGKHFAKSDPGRFQERVLSCYQQRKAEVLRRI